MRLHELFQYALLNSGNHLIPEKSLEYTSEQFLSVLKICLGIYNRYTPMVYSLNMVFHQLNYKFLGTEYPDYPIFKEKLIPDKISDVIPVYTTILNPFTSWVQSQQGIPIDEQQKQMFVWRYDKPTLHLDRMGEMEIITLYEHPILQKTDKSTGLKYWDLPTIRESDVSFLDLMTAKFMIMIGRSRRLFAQSESPINIDFAGLIQDGAAMEQEAMKYILANARFHWSWG